MMQDKKRKKVDGERRTESKAFDEFDLGFTGGWALTKLLEVCARARVVAYAIVCACVAISVSESASLSPLLLLSLRAPASNP